MTFTTHRGRRAALALSLAACLVGPGLAQAQSDDGPPNGGPLRPRPPAPAQAIPQGRPMGQQGQPQGERHHHNSGVGAAIGAGLVGGLVGGALLGGQRQSPGYAPEPAYAPPPPPPPAYEVEDEPECRIVRKPVYDEDGEVVSYRTRRICR